MQPVFLNFGGSAAAVGPKPFPIIHLLTIWLSVFGWGDRQYANPCTLLASNAENLLAPAGMAKYLWNYLGVERIR